MSNQDFSIVILAAGKATRFKSERSKVLHTLAGRPLGEYVLRTALALKPHQTLMVIGHDAEESRKTFARPGVTFIEQEEQLGTGHGLLVARPELKHCPSSTVLTLVGDAPLLCAETLRQLVVAHANSGAAATVLTTRRPDPQGYGRVVRASGNRVRAIIEEKIATAAQRKIREINSGIICFSRSKLLEHLGKLSRDNAQKEYLLTDLVAIFNQHRQKVVAFPADDWREVLGVNDRIELAEVEKILRLRKAEDLMRDGVTIVNPEATYIDENVEVGPDTIIEPGVSLLGRTRVGRTCLLRLYSTIEDSVLGDRVTVRMCSVITGTEVASDVVIGPFAHLRDGAVIEQEARIGNFVEVKKTRVGRGSKALHLAYLGDAAIGSKVNVGAVTVTCNYDGEKKNPTIVENGCFIGSGAMLVAPVRIGRGAYVGAGSTITEDVPAESLALGRARQINKEGWAKTRGRTETPNAVIVREAGPVTILDLAGMLTLGERANELHDKILEAVKSGRKRVLINLSRVVYVDSAGMGEIIGATTSLRNAGGDLKLTGVPEKVLRLLEAANLHRLVEIHPHEAAALASFGQDPPAEVPAQSSERPSGGT